MNEPFDEEISALYRDASQEHPPAHLDDAILAAAKREVRAGPKPLSPFSTKWTLPFSLAAVIVLSVSVVTLVQKESPREIASGIGSVEKATEEAQFLKERGLSENKIAANQPAENERQEEEVQTEKNIAKLKMKAERPQVEARQVSPGAPEPPPAPAERSAKQSTKQAAKQSAKQSEPPQRLAKSPAPKPTVSSGLPADVARSDVSAPANTERPPTREAPKLSMETTLADEQTKSEAKRLQKPAAEETLYANTDTTAAADSTASVPAETSASTSTVEDESRKASRNQALGFMQGQTQSQSQSEPQTQSSMTAAARPSTPPEAITSQSVDEPVSAVASVSAAPSCASLSARDCLQSSYCTYEWRAESVKPDKQYVCRAAADQCERDFRQLTGTQQSCESKPGCRYIPGHCQCPEGLPCDCQNKNPPQCAKQ